MNSSVIARGLEQAEALLSDVPEAAWDAPTPCTDWTVRELIDHLVNLPAQFTTMALGESVDWTAPTPRHDDSAEAFNAHAKQLLAALGAHPESVPEGMLAGELSVHSWDLASAVGGDSSGFDPEIAETGYAFMSVALTDEQRGQAFGPRRPAPDGANAYERLAAFAGREVPFRPER
ncbi:TIGR03086 family metal-binding protein [Aeromicrobium duanguangcaii]|uniref:TIGR03086 family metal-binding protein n=1 Tax=Aeromicrobium duanguangcaii TaxID=2968086 RepID=A0ABY5KDL7_9ACTN|nr:TIGR03086 family metal-binding protein [Aeromicrobium duanguangcaii]MCD9152840.1 TIGR03086 family metal-binding protein [Aeromicrobium duanguangcaii]UUI67180.1 TIGR03086 family metal-binding protein [Aeromicrobium duanguangcaii]